MQQLKSLNKHPLCILMNSFHDTSAISQACNHIWTSLTKHSLAVYKNEKYYLIKLGDYHFCFRSMETFGFSQPFPSTIHICWSSLSGNLTYCSPSVIYRHFRIFAFESICSLSVATTFYRILHKKRRWGLIAQNREVSIVLLYPLVVFYFWILLIYESCDYP